MIALAAAVLALQSAPPASAAASRPLVLPPIDECGADVGFARFRAELLDALARRDVARLRPMVAEDIFYTFGGDAGRDAFFEDWGLDGDPNASGLWTALAETLMLGCARLEGERVAPYAFARWPEFDDVGTSFLARPGAAFYPRPEVDGEPIAILAWHVVEDAGPEGATGNSLWRRVRLADGRTGYVRETELRVDIDYRASFEQRGDRWLLATFVAGD